MKRMEFNMPATWALSFKESECFDDSEFICHTEEYEITPSPDSFFSAIFVTRYIGIVPAPYETIEEWSDGNVEEFNFEDIPVYYYVDQNTAKDSPILRCAFETPGGSLITVNASIKDSINIDSAISFLSGFFEL